MKSVQRHVVKCLIAGIVALLPIGGTLLMILYFEDQLASSWLADQPFYHFGMGIVLALLMIYGVGLTLSTFLGRWLWMRADLIFTRLPLLGPLYRTLKQLLGYGDGPDAMFKQVVMVTCRDIPGEQIGFVTAKVPKVGGEEVAVFLPAAPNPAAGRLIYMRAEDIRPIPLSVTEAMKALVSAGALPLEKSPDEASESNPPFETSAPKEA